MPSRPAKRAGRFSRKAAMPFLLVRGAKGRCEEPGLEAKPLVEARLEAAGSTACLQAATATGPFGAKPPRSPGTSAGGPRPAPPRPGARAPGHVSASTISPVKRRRLATEGPTSRASRWVPPKPGGTPRPTSGCPSLARSLPMRMSQARASSHPPPRAKPFTAAITGRGKAADPCRRPSGLGGRRPRPRRVTERPWLGCRRRPRRPCRRR